MHHQLQVIKNALEIQESIFQISSYSMKSRTLNGDSQSKNGQITQINVASVKSSSNVTESLSLLFQMLYIPFFAIGINIFCNEVKCSFISLPEWNNFLSLATFFDLWSILGYCILAFTLAILAVLPLGGKKVSSLIVEEPRFIYYTNGFFSMLIVIFAYGIIECFWFSLSTYIVNHSFHLVVASYVFGIFFSAFLYLKSYLLPEGCTKTDGVDITFLHSFFYGRELNPRLFNILDFKQLMLRIYAVSLILVDIAYLIKGLHLDTRLVPAIQANDMKIFTSHPTLLVLITLHLIYFVGYLYEERVIVSTAFVQYESLGYACAAGVLLYPFYLIAQTKYIMDHQVNYNNWELLLLCSVCFVGYVFFFMSNAQKYSFRVDPTSTKFESIPTTKGKKILSSGFWGFVRQPNILGDIIIHVCFLRFGIDVPVAFGIIAIIFMLLDRAKASQMGCKQKYGAAWDQYCQKVKYILVPFVY